MIHHGQLEPRRVIAPDPVTLDYVKNKNLPALEASLAAKGINETVAIQMARGPASTDGPVTCAQGPGVSGPTVRVTLTLRPRSGRGSW